jgi:hypothetical protein
MPIPPLGKENSPPSPGSSLFAKLDINLLVMNAAASPEVVVTGVTGVMSMFHLGSGFSSPNSDISKPIAV